ncbi:helix-turn-helix transcriptional regulator [Enterococcus faecalis]|nr:YafY family transcriptional regulator [Enterococcus faecalis]
MQESRLFRIVYYLIQKGKTTAPELAQKFEVSVRTIYRDIDVISSVGIPIYATQGKNGGIMINEDFTLDRSILSQKEKEQILCGLQGLFATNVNNTNGLLTKMSALFHLEIPNWLEVDFSDWIQGQSTQNIFNDIKTAILEKYIISFEYCNNLKHSDFRTIQPLKLIFKSKSWYVYGFCMLRNDYRLFKLRRIEHLKITEEHFTSFETIPELDKFIKKDSLVTVTLKFDRKMAFRVYDEFSRETITEQKDFLFVTTVLPNNNILYSYILSFGEYVEIIEPKEIRKNMNKQLKKIQEKY